MPRHAPTFTLAAHGTCAFCGKTRSETPALVGSPTLDVRICDGCLGMCCSILADNADALADAPACSGAEFPEVLLARILATLATKPPGTMPPAHCRCSFCDATRPDDVPVLVSGPRVFICSACVGDAVAVVKRTLRA